MKKKQYWKMESKLTLVVSLLALLPTFGMAVPRWSVMSNVDAPSPRMKASAVWTGEEMMVWGGYEGHSTLLGTGGLYHPIKDSWRPVSTVNAPEARAVSLVWTGTEVIVWGGYGENGALGDGARYDPVTDKWSTMSQQGAPSARINPVAVWTGEEMIVAGGSDSGNSYHDGARYNPKTDTWSPIEDCPGKPGGFGAWTGTEMIGWRHYQDAMSSYRYNLQFDRWNSMTVKNEPIARYDFEQTWTGNQLLVWGGTRYIEENGETKLLWDNSGGVYNPKNNSWLAMSMKDAPVGRIRHSMGWVSGMAVVFGGMHKNANLSSGAIFHPDTNSWEPLVNFPLAARSLHSAVSTGSEYIVWGGHYMGLHHLNDGAILHW